ncbi:MAG TPA: PKD domain-containing protein [Thermoleophilaceae bacterium]|nr:PKD domain-containing protein [Thermoleophilaceae bacterium]
MILLRSLCYLAVALAVALVVAVSANAASRDLDRSFGDDGIALTAVGESDAYATDMALQPNGKIVVGGIGNSPLKGDDDVEHPDQRGAAIARFNPDGTLDRSFGGDGIVLDHYSLEGSSIDAVAVQPDGKIVVAGGGNCCVSTLYVARYMPDGARDLGFGDDGLLRLGIRLDSTTARGIALQPDGRILIGGFTNSEDIEPFVVRLTTDGERDPTYGTNGVARLTLGNPQIPSADVGGLVLQDGKAVISGSSSGDGHVDLFVARLDEFGALDQTFGDGGVVYDRAGNDDQYVARDLGLWSDKLIVTGFRGETWEEPRNYLLGRFDGLDGARDTSFNPGGTDPGYVFAGAGDGPPRGDSLAIDPVTGAITVAGTAEQDGIRKLMVVRYLSDGSRDDTGFRSANGNVGPRLLSLGDGSLSLNGADPAVALDAEGGIVVATTALDAGRNKFALVRLGDTRPEPNARPVARIRGQHVVPRNRWVRFGGLRSFDRDGRIVEYAWRTDNGPFRPLGPVFWHRFGRLGVHVVTLRVTDDGGAVSYATFRVNVRRASRS